MNLIRTGGAITALSIAAGLWVGAPAGAQVAPPFTVLHQFTGGKDSEGPDGDLAVGKDGALYGTSSGFYLTFSTLTDGSVFKMTTAGAFTVLHSFTGTDGSNPQSNIVQDKSGNFYGATTYGGVQNEGTLFQITAAGHFSTLVSFDGFDTGHGDFPTGNLLLGKDGNLYGTTYTGGSGGFGTLYRATTSGVLTDLVGFNFSSGSAPTGGLAEDAAGNLYGMTQFGGANKGGTVFAYLEDFPVLPEYSFSALDANYDNSDGSSPQAGLVTDSEGNLYGTTVQGGAYGHGVIFEITSSAVYTLYNFTGGADGGYPFCRLAFGKDGILYGTTRSGGNGYGTIFSIWPDGSHFTTLYSFSTTDASYHNHDGAFPETGLTLGKDGNFYGTAFAGGINADGTLFKLTMIPLVTRLSPASGPVGTKVTVSGTNFTETLGVKIGKVAASYTINSDKSLTITIPSGAVSGKITVLNSFGSGLSAATFKVTP